MDTELLIKKILQCAYNVRAQLTQGYLESVYQKAMLIELEKKGLQAESELPLKVYYDSLVVGEFRVDILVEKKIILELKAVQQLCLAHEAQLVNYLTTTHINDGLLINFGAERIEIKRKYRVYRK